MFRPYAINPWMLFNDMAQKEGKSMTIGFLHQTIQRDGWRMLSRNVFPLMLANGAVGTIMFQSYTVTCSFLQSTTKSKYFIAGATAGVTSTIFSRPLDRFTKLVSYRMVHDKLSFHEARKAAVKFLPLGFDRVNYLYKGLSYHLVRDSIGFGVFFGVFETMQSFGKTLTSSTHFIPNRPKELALADGCVVIFSGALAGASFQLISYPLETLKKKARELRKIHPEKSISEVNRIVIKHIGVRGLFKGAFSQLIRVMPPSAMGLFVYEISKDWLGKIQYLKA